MRMLGGSTAKSLTCIKQGAGAASYFPPTLNFRTGETMADTTRNDPEEVLEEPVPAMQQLLDNPFLLLFIGIATPTVLYTIWGVMEIVNLPIAK
jgi:hypothetical protein